jgi:hypothetical protein
MKKATKAITFAAIPAAVAGVAGVVASRFRHKPQDLATIVETRIEQVIRTAEGELSALATEALSEGREAARDGYSERVDQVIDRLKEKLDQAGKEMKESLAQRHAA